MFTTDLNVTRRSKSRSKAMRNKKAAGYVTGRSKKRSKTMRKNMSAAKIQAAFRRSLARKKRSSR